MARELLGALTPVAYPYPEYINISRENGGVLVTLRAPAVGEEWKGCGQTIEVNFAETAFRALWREVGERLGGL